MMINRIESIIDNPVLEAGLKKYKFIMDSVNNTDVSTDKEFQSVFRDFYQMRRFYNDDFADAYFGILENLKKGGTISFKMAFERIKHIKGSAEMSFSSKMAHTLDPSNPIWDSVVTKQHFRISTPTVIKDWSKRERACIDRYEMYKMRFFEYMESSEGVEIIRLFDQRFPNNNISDTKKIDFVLWQDR